MNGMVQLETGEVVAGRYFTHPQHIYYDGRILSYMLRRLCHLLESGQPTDPPTPVLKMEHPEPDGRDCRFIVVRPEQLAPLTDLVVVGFFGQRRYDADPHPVARLDSLLVSELVEHPGLLSYITLELTNGDYANCVLFADDDAKSRWSLSETHSRTANEISPNYYFSIRLYNGRLPSGLMQSDNLHLDVVKYYDYRGESLWRAMRPIG